MSDGAGVIQRMMDAANGADFDAMATCWAEDAVDVYPDGRTVRGRTAIRDELSIAHQAWPDERSEEIRLYEQDNTVIAEFVWRATHTGVLASSMGDIAATGRRLEVPCCNVFEIADGVITECRSYQNYLLVVRQLGLLG